MKILQFRLPVVADIDIRDVPMTEREVPYVPYPVDDAERVARLEQINFLITLFIFGVLIAVTFLIEFYLDKGGL